MASSPAMLFVVSLMLREMRLLMPRAQPADLQDSILVGSNTWSDSSSSPSRSRTATKTCRINFLMLLEGKHRSSAVITGTMSQDNELNLSAFSSFEAELVLSGCRDSPSVS